MKKYKVIYYNNNELKFIIVDSSSLDSLLSELPVVSIYEYQIISIEVIPTAS